MVSNPQDCHRHTADVPVFIFLAHWGITTCDSAYMSLVGMQSYQAICRRRIPATLTL
ncbi:hypothetical protein FA10DRAFT_265279 [Acaromyces ingoldii]|uniref:Uncharacterized protein n=1 Tax=Acaromyces ingoldii TaxID=215250 RepID=A0A316YPF4_9BASI|nr:hypothetical protein FA10DRAFT_265279 [Acaromyces ingoldii]PWN91420.1 hypothetical protein FA10DRAFT_265279 [Acaromyces ingoldii]